MPQVAHKPSVATSHSHHANARTTAPKSGSPEPANAFSQMMDEAGADASQASERRDTPPASKSEPVRQARSSDAPVKAGAKDRPSDQHDADADEPQAETPVEETSAAAVDAASVPAAPVVPTEDKAEVTAEAAQPLADLITEATAAPVQAPEAAAVTVTADEAQPTTGPAAIVALEGAEAVRPTASESVSANGRAEAKSETPEGIQPATVQTDTETGPVAADLKAVSTDKSGKGGPTENRPTAARPGDAPAPAAETFSASLERTAPADQQVQAPSSQGPNATAAAHRASEPAPVANTPAAPPQQQAAIAVPIAGLPVEIAARVQAGSNRFEIRLDPPELGRIDVRLDIDRQGQVTSRLMVEKVETLDLLRRDAHQLERALQDAGLKTSDNGLQFSLRDQSFAGREGDKNGREVARLIVPDHEVAADLPVTTYGRLNRLGGGVDIRV